MPDHSSDAMPAAEATPAPDVRSGRRRRRTDWRLGGRSVRLWREPMLAVALISLGVGVASSALVTSLSPAPWAGALATALLGATLLVPVVWAFTRSVPIGLLRFRPVDLLYGVVLGVMLRVVQGLLETGLGGPGALPSYALVNGNLADDWWFSDALWVLAVAPVAEEFFFRGVILVTIFTLLRRAFGATAAGFVAIVVSTALFVLVHAIDGSVTADQAISLALLGLVCASLVMSTGRIWSAVIVHAIFNATFVVLALVGTFFG